MASWFYKIDDVEHGPISQDELLKMVQHGRLAADDMIRNETKKKWYKARSVKGLTFPADNEQPTNGPATNREAPPSAATSIEARNLLKGFGKNNKEKSTGETGAADSWEARQKKSSNAVMSQPTKGKPLDRRTKQIMGVTGVLLLLIILFPPHQAPEGLTLTEGWFGRHTFIFTPPVMKLDADKSSMGNVDIGSLKTEGGKIFVEADMPINGLRIFLEGLAVIVMAAAAIGFLAARKAAGEVPDPKSAHPPRRRAV